MKFRLFSISFGLIILSTVACSKRYNCDCTYDIQTNSGTMEATYSDEIKAKNQDDAQPECDAIKNDLASDTSNINVACDLK